MGWAAASVVMMILLGYSLFDLRGSLPKIDAASSQTISADGVQAIDIHAEGVAVEVGSSYDTVSYTHLDVYKRQTQNLWVWC